jgi:hypothetical protein
VVRCAVVCACCELQGVSMMGGERLLDSRNQNCDEHLWCRVDERALPLWPRSLGLYTLTQPKVHPIDHMHCVDHETLAAIVRTLVAAQHEIEMFIAYDWHWAAAAACGLIAAHWPLRRGVLSVSIID